MLTIDAHQHFWHYNAVRDHWITDEMSVIQRDFFPLNLEPVLKRNGIAGCVVVQSDQSLEENDFQLTNAKYHDFIKGVVGWVDFYSDHLEDQLIRHKQFAKLKGFRHVLQGEPQRDLMLQPEFRLGIGLLSKYNFTYDLLILPDQLKFAEQLVSSFPDQKFVVDHIAKPPIREKKIADWKKDIEALAVHENTYCKISGMVTEADWKEWRHSDIIPYIDVVVEAFGDKRIMFGSDWPVCLVAGTYEKMLLLVKDYFSAFSRTENDLFFGGNAIKFYNL